MATYHVGDTFSNGFYVLETPTSTNNNTGLYLVGNVLGFQYYVAGTTLDTYDEVGNFNGSGGSSGSGGSNTGGGSTTTVIVSGTPDPLMGSPFMTVSAGATGSQIVSGVSGSMVRLVNLSDLNQGCIILGYDNASTTSGRLLFAQQLQAQQVVDINTKTYQGITLSILGTVNSDYGFNVVNDTGGHADLTGYPHTEVTASSSATTIIYGNPCTCVGLRNNSQTDQTATLVGYDNASTTSGRRLFRQQLSAGECVDIRETATFGITVGIENGPTNGDYGVNVLYASSTS